MRPGTIGLTLHSPSGRLSAGARALTVSPPESVCSCSDCHSITASVVITIARSTRSNRTLDSAREGIHNDVHAEARVVDRRESLTVRVVVPLRAVVLATVENGDAIALHHRLKVFVHQVVAPAVQL